MAAIPVVCDNGHVWLSMNAIGGSGSVSMTGTRIGPCPACSAMGSAPDGIYEFSDEATRILDELSGEEIVRVQRIVEQGQKAGASPSEIAKTIEREVPGAAALGRFLADPKLIGVVAILALFLQWKSYQLQAEQAGKTDRPPIVVPAETHVPQSTGAARRPAPADSCWCGSGSRFMHCHGRQRGRR